MEAIDILTAIGGVMLSVIGYFLRSSMQEIKEIKKVSYTNKSDIKVLQNEHGHLVENFEKLYDAVKELTIEIKELNKRIK
jgi:uncharacterized protein YoxC